MKIICDKNVSDSYTNEVESIINDSNKKIFDFFEESVRKLPVTIYIYNTIESLKLNLTKRGFKEDPPYMCASFKDEDNSINLFEPKNNPNPDEWTKDEYRSVIFHENIHVVQYNLFGYKPEWFCEGIAKYLDGSYKRGDEDLVKNHIDKIPNQSEIENEFGYHDYNSYDYAYVMISYIINNYGKDMLIKCLKDDEILKAVSKNLLKKSINFYQSKEVKSKTI